MNTLLENIEKQLKKDLLELDNLEPLERYNRSTTLINKAIADLKEFLANHTFENPQDEITFFKETRPAILSEKIKVGLVYNLSVNEPIGTKEILMQYFEELLKGFQSMFKLNAFYYQYYKNHFSELDHLYFIRDSNHSMIPLPEISDLEHTYSTPMSDLFAKFIAYEQTNYYIIKKVSGLVYNQEIAVSQESDFNLRWTGEIINLVELAYGIWLTGQVNNGNASLNQIVRWLELNLDVNIGIVQVKFAEMARRKRIPVTKFLLQMTEAVLKKIEAGNE